MRRPGLSALHHREHHCLRPESDASYECSGQPRAQASTVKASLNEMQIYLVLTAKVFSKAPAQRSQELSWPFALLSTVVVVTSRVHMQSAVWRRMLLRSWNHPQQLKQKLQLGMRMPMLMMMPIWRVPLKVLQRECRL